jgi:hypothetical protein
MKIHRPLSPCLCLAALLAAFFSGAPAWVPQEARAQAPMMDPSAMSGIPRPDPQVPEGTITVRLIRGELQNRLPDTEVDLVNLAKAGEKRTQKTDAEGRATFSGLPAGTYEARAAVDGEALASQPMELSTGPGLRVMLVFQKSLADQQREIGTPDGKARVSTQLPGGALHVKAVDEKGQPLPGLSVVVNHGDRETEKVDALPEQKTGADGVARFTGLKTGPGDGYLVSVVRDNVGYRSKPFRLVQNHGSHVTIEVRPASRDIKQVRIGAGSHLIIELQDDTVQVLENLLLQNPTEQTVDPGAEGLRLPLPAGALSPQVLPGQGGQSPPVSIDVSRPGEAAAVWKGPMPPGVTEIRIGFILRHSGEIRFRQTAALDFDSLRIIVERGPEMKIEAPGYESEARKFNGRDLFLLSGPPPKAGGVIEFTLTGLPYNAPTLRWLAAALALGILGGLGLLAYHGRPAQGTDQGGGADQGGAGTDRSALERRRKALLSQIAEIDAGEGKRRKGKDREQLMKELEGIYRALQTAEDAEAPEARAQGAA